MVSADNNKWVLFLLFGLVVTVAVCGEAREEGGVRSRGLVGPITQV